MLKKFVEGLVFGSGFGIAFVVVWMVGMSFAVPRMITSFTTGASSSEFKNPSQAKVVAANATSATEAKEFSFFSHSSRMEIPSGGGILAMSPTATTIGSRRPSTYQLWLTQTALWQIRTTEEKVEIEQLPYPGNASISDLDKLMLEKYGLSPSSMTVSSGEIAALKTTGSSGRDKTLNGSLKVSTEGVVFVMPNPYAT